MTRDRSFWILVPALGMICLALGLWRDQRALIDAFDTGLYLQLSSNVCDGGSLASSVTGEPNFFAHHFQPLVLLVAPLACLIPRPTTLLALSLLATLLGLALVRRAPDTLRGPWGLTLAFAFLAHPGIAARFWHGFSPDVLALPAFLWMATQLVRGERAPVWAWLLALLWAGGAKETFWLTNAAVCVAASLRERQRRTTFLALAAAQVGIFAFLFLHWMPARSTMPSYYGLKYYLGPDFTGQPTFGELVQALAANLFSTRSLETLGLLALTTVLLPFLRLRAVLLAAVPGLALILLSRSGIVHHPANHYLVPVLPFLLLAAWRNTSLAFVPKHRMIYLIAASIPLGLAVLQPAGLLDAVLVIDRSPRTAHFRADTEAFASRHLPPDAPLIVDGTLQTVLPRHRDTAVLLGYVGNPRRLGPDDLARGPFILTSEDLMALPDCSQVRVGGAQMRADQERFLYLCMAVQRTGIPIAAFPDSGLFAYRLPAAAL